MDLTWRPWLALRGGLDWPYVEALAGLTWRPWRVGWPYVEALAGRALHGAVWFGRADFGRARWRPQFVCVEESLWDWSFRGGLGCLMRRPCIKALASAFLAGARFGDCVKAWCGYSYVDVVGLVEGVAT